MTIYKKIGVVAGAVGIALGVLAFLGISLGGSSTHAGATSFVSGQVQNTPMLFTNGFAAGSSQQFIVDANGALTSAAATVSSVTNTTGLQTNAGVKVQPVHNAMQTGTTTQCAVQSPFATASSTFSFTMNVSSSSAVAGQVVIATSSTAFSTSTPVGEFSIPANQQYIFNGIGTTTAGTAGVVGPSGWIVAGNSATGATTQYGGICQAIFTSTN